MVGLKPLPFGVRLVGVFRVGAVCFPVPRSGSAREQKWVWPVGNGRSGGRLGAGCKERRWGLLVRVC
jgi:hypothetical protein